MGLLDYDFSKALNSDQGRLGLGLLAAAAPSNQGFGQRLQSALGYVQGQQDRDMQKQMQQFQMQDLIAQAAARKREAERQAKAEQTQQKVSEYAKQFMPQVGPQMPDESIDLMQPQKPQGFNMQGFLQGLPGVMDDPLQALEYAKKFAPEKEEAYTLGEGQQRFRGNMLIAQGPEKKPNMSTDLLVPGPDGKLIPNAALIAVKEGLAKAAKPVTTIDARNFNTQESEQSKAYGKQLGEIRGAINQAGFDAPGKLARLDRMEQLLQGIDGGAAAPALADVASFAQSMGIKIDPKLGNKQAAEALAREMAGTLRQPGTGPMTDKDFENFLKQVPSLSKTAEGRAEITKTLRAAIQRDQTAAQFSRQYANKNKGVIDDAFFDSMADFYAKNPVVTPKMPAANSRGQLFQNADSILNRK